MKKMIFLGWLIVFIPAMVFAQDKIDAPVWNVGDQWIFTLGNIEVVSADQNSYTLNFSNDTCIFQNQGFKAIIFEKSTLNRIGVLKRGNRKEYTMGLRKILNFPFTMGKQWKDDYSGESLIDRHIDMVNSYSETFAILGWEDREVQAGKFRTIKLEYKQVITASPSMWTPIGFERKAIFWYSPAAKYFVKCQYINFPDVVKDWELSSFKEKK